MRIFIGSSSNENISSDYLEDCRKLLEVVLKDNDLVFGANKNSLMGLCYDIAKQNNRKVTGICPEVYKDSLKDLECDKEVITYSIIDSTMKIYQNSDAVIFLPGGLGTMFEFFTANYCKICKEFDKPVIVYNSLVYYDKLISFIEDSYEKGFIREKDRNHFVVANTPEEVMKYLKNGE